MTPLTERAIQVLVVLGLAQTMLLFGIFMFLSFEADLFAWLWTIISTVVIAKHWGNKVLDEVEG